MTSARRDRLRALLGEHELDALLVTTQVNVRYLTGFTGSAGQVLVTADPAADVFVTDGRYDEQSAAQVGDLRRLIVPPADWVSDAIGRGARLGLEAHTVAWERARALQQQHGTVVAAPALVETLRVVKDASEIASLRTACHVTDAAFAALTGWLAPGISERDAATRLNADLVAAGSADRAFDLIFAAGPNTAVPHHSPGDRLLQAGDLIKVDFGAVIDGYHSDMTRMLSLGTPPARLGEVFEVVLDAQRRGLAAATEGGATGAVDAACRDAIDAAGFTGRFIHGTGHGIGLEIHEDPFLRPEQPRPEASASASVTLRSGMAVTVEPGVYLPGVGGVRIEDSLVITPAGPDVLTRTPKDLVVL